jgi:hypothetical protein
MLRYDPKRHQSRTEFHVDVVSSPTDDASASKRVEDASVTDDDDNDESVMEGVTCETKLISENGLQSSLEDASGQIVEQDIRKNIYEQQKLEDVFREARDIPPSASLPLESSKSNNSAASVQNFSFGFAFESIQNSIDINSIVPVTVCNEDMTGEDMNHDEPSIATSETSLVEPDNDLTMIDVETLPFKSSNKKRQNPYDFFDDAMDGNGVLDKLVHFSYHDALAEGQSIRMLNDLESFRKDTTVIDSWKKQRKYLTDDWKRKQKQLQKF